MHKETRKICSILACLRDNIRNLTKHWVESRERKGQRREEERGKKNNEHLRC